MAAEHDSWLQGAFGINVASIVSKAKSAADTVSGVANSAVDKVENLGTSAAAEVKSTVQGVETAASSAVDKAKTVASSAATGVKSTVQGVQTGASSAVNKAKTAVSDDVKQAVATGSQVASKVKAAAVKEADAAASTVKDGAKVAYQGMKDNAKAVDKGEGLLDKGVDWLTDEAKSGTKWMADEAKGIPVAGQVAQDIKKVADVGIDVEAGMAKAVTAVGAGAVKVVANPIDGAKDIYQGMKDNAKLVKEGEDYTNKGIDWLEDEGKSGTKWMADKAKGIPVAEQLAQGVKQTVDQGIDFEGGLAKGVTGLVGGVVGAVANPVDTARALEAMSEHLPVTGLPTKALHEMYDVAAGNKTMSQAGKELTDPTDDAKYWKTVGEGLIDPIEKSFKAGKPMEGVGQAVAQIGSLFIGAGEVGAAGKVVEGAGAATKVLDAAGATTKVLDAAATTTKVVDAAATTTKVVDAAGTTTKVLDGADVAGTTGKVTDLSEAGGASKAKVAADAKAQVTVDPDVDPHAPTEPPPPPPVDPRSPTQLPPEYLKNPQIPKAPRVPREFEVPKKVSPAEIEPESPEAPKPESDPVKPEEKGGESRSEPDGDKPPEDDYDVEGWKKYYEKHPEVKRSVGAAGANDPKMAQGAGKAGAEEEAASETPKEKTEPPPAAPKVYTREEAGRLIDESEGQVIDSSKPAAKGHAEAHTGSSEESAMDLPSRRKPTTMYRNRVQAEKDLRDFLNRHSEELDKLPPGGKLELTEPVSQPRQVYDAKPYAPMPDAAEAVTTTTKQQLFVKIIKTDDGLHLRTMYLKE